MTLRDGSSSDFRRFDEENRARRTLWLLGSPAATLPREVEKESLAIVAHWRRPLTDAESAGISATCVALPDLVAAHRMDHIKRYFTLLERLGRARVADGTVERAWCIRPGLSMWWLGLPLQYSNDSHATAFTVMRLWEIENLVRSHQITRIVNTLEDRAVSDALRQWAGRMGVDYRAERRPGRCGGSPQVRQSLTRLRCLAGAWILLLREFAPPLRGNRHATSASRPLSGTPGIAIADYFANFSSAGLARGEYESSYWDGLPRVLTERVTEVAWLHLFVPGSLPMGRRRVARQALPRLADSRWHSLSCDWSTWRVWLGALKDLGRIAGTRKVVPALKGVCAEDELNLWPVLRGPIRGGNCGLGALRTLLWLGVMERFARSVPEGTPLLYLQENQPWEVCLVWAWRRYTGGRTHGVVHTVIRPWDLRYAIGVRLRAGAAMVALPAVTLVNGPAARQAMGDEAEYGCELIEVEALRFLREPASQPEHATSRGGELLGTHDRSRRLLVLGEHDDAYSQQLIAVAQRFQDLTAQQGYSWSIVWRPHPAGSTVEVPQSWVVEASGPLHAVLTTGTLVLAGETSTALLWPVSAGLPVAVVPPPDTFGSLTEEVSATVVGVASGCELVDILSTCFPQASDILERLFHRDPELPRWRAFLEQCLDRNQSAVHDSPEKR